MPHDYSRMASELLRSLRGRRSQVAFARRLKYRSNVVYSWESGRAYPTAAGTLRIATGAGVDVRAAISRFYRHEPSWFRAHPDPTTAAAVAALLDDLRGRTPIVAVAKEANLSRYRVARWMAGETEPRLPDLLRMIEATSQRLLDFVAALVDPTSLPSAATAFRQLEAARRAAYDVPWSQAVLRVLELRSYQRLRVHRPGWIAERLGISTAEEERCLELLVQSHQLRLRAGKYELTRVQTVDTRSDVEAARRLRAFWARVGSERLEGQDGGTFAYALFGVSARDLARIRDLQTAYYRELRAIVSQSQPVERVALAALHLLPLA